MFDFCIEVKPPPSLWVVCLSISVFCLDNVHCGPPFHNAVVGKSACAQSNLIIGVSIGSTYK